MRLEPTPWNHDGVLPGAATEPTVDPQDTAILTDSLERTLDCAQAAEAARQLLARFGDMSGVLGASPESLANTPGVGALAAADLVHLRELAIRLTASRIDRRFVIGSWTALLSYVGAQLRHERSEQFRVLFLDARHGLIRDEQLGQGTIDHAPVYVREVVRRALELGAAALILVHNHPAGDPTPSRADIDMTRQIVEAGRLLRLSVHDHLIVGRDEVASFKSLGLL